MPAAATRRLSPASGSAPRRCTAPSAASWKATCRPPWRRRHDRASRASCRARRKPCWWRTACASPPEGRARWAPELLADAVVRLTNHAALSRETVRRRLGENQLKPWRRDRWCIPQVDGSFVARMEDVLDLYAEAPDPRRPVVCFDESALHLIGEARQPISAAPGQ